MTRAYEKLAPCMVLLLRAKCTQSSGLGIQHFHLSATRRRCNKEILLDNIAGAKDSCSEDGWYLYAIYSLLLMENMYCYVECLLRKRIFAIKD